MIVSPPRIEEAQGLVRSIARVTFADGHAQDLWFGVEPRHGAHLRPGDADPFLLGLLQVAMSRGEELVLEGCVSARLKQHADMDLQAVLLLLRLEQRRIRVSAGSLRADGAEGQGVGTGFSGGVDSFVTLCDFTDPACPPEYRLTHLFFHGVGALEERDFGPRVAQARAVADLVGLDLVAVSSNLPALNPLPFSRSHILRNLACAALLPGLLRRFYFSAGFTFADFRADADEIAMLLPALAPLLSTAATEFVPAGSEYTRVEKTRRLADFPIAWRHLNVCVAPDTVRNCSRCWKCGRTLLTLECLGVVDRFAEAFDLDVWRQARAGYVGEHVLNPRKRGSPLNREVLELATASGLHFTPRERLLGALAPALPKRLYDRAARIVGGG